MNQDLLANTAPGCDGCTSETGSSNTQIFQRYLTEHFMKYMQTGSSINKLLLYDEHKSHIHPDIFEFVRNHDITLFVPPPHISHLLHPLDVACFGPLQKFYDQEAQNSSYKIQVG